MSAKESDWRSTDVRAIAPLYKRLPKGPHGFAPEEVIHHQRIRMHGAMIEAVAEHGYERMSVKHVIGLAGVSRRAFYEQFANKEDCFMETFDLIVNRTIKRVTAACRASEGPLEGRLRAGLRAFVEEIETSSKALHLVAIDALTAGPDGLLRQRRALAASEQLVASSFASPPAGTELPAPLVRAIVGGLHRGTLTRLRDPSRSAAEGQSALTGEMLRWTMLFAAPAVQRLQPRASSRRAPSGVVALQSSLAASDDRERLLESIVNLALREPYEELSAPHIAHEAGLPIDTFLDLFESPRACFKAALDMLGGELLETVADPALVSADWPLAVCRAIERMTAHLARNPAYAVMLAAKTMAAGLEIVEEMVFLADEVATLLTEGAPRRARTRSASTWISGALAYTLHTEVMAGRTHLLECLTDYVSYIVLAPYIGPERALQTIAEAAKNPARGTDASERSGQGREDGEDADAAQRREAAARVDSAHAERAGGAVSGAAEVSARAADAGDGEEDALSEEREEDAAQEPLATPVGAADREVGEHDAREQRDHDHDDEGGFAGADDPTDLDLAEIEDGEQRDQHGQRHPPPGARQLAL